MTLILTLIIVLLVCNENQYYVTVCADEGHRRKRKLGLLGSDVRMIIRRAVPSIGFTKKEVPVLRSAKECRDLPLTLIILDFQISSCSECCMLYSG